MVDADAGHSRRKAPQARRARFGSGVLLAGARQSHGLARNPIAAGSVSFNA